MGPGDRDSKMTNEAGQQIEVDSKALLPWWRRPLPVAAITATLAAVIPATIAVSGIIQHNKEIALKIQDGKMEELKTRHSIEMDYLQHMQNDEDRVRLLRMVLATSADPILKNWAREEKGRVDKAIADYQKEAEQADSKARISEKGRAAMAQALIAEAEQDHRARLAYIARAVLSDAELKRLRDAEMRHMRASEPGPDPSEVVEVHHDD